MLTWQRHPVGRGYSGRIAVLARRGDDWVTTELWVDQAQLRPLRTP